MKVICINDEHTSYLEKDSMYDVLDEFDGSYRMLIKGRLCDFSKDRFIKLEDAIKPIKTNNIKPQHYNKGKHDLYESWYLTRPMNEFRAIMESIAERYMKRDKIDRLEDLDKCMETLRRLREYEVRYKEENGGTK